MAKKEEKISDYDDPKGRGAAIFLLILMVFSVAGFAVLMGGPAVDNSTGSSKTPSEVPFGGIFQNSQTGEVILGTVRNNEQFIFQNITGYDNNTQMLDLAERIKSSKKIEIYVDTNFTSKDSLFLIEKALKGIKKDNSRIQIEKCEANTIIFTNNPNKSGNCGIFYAPKGEEYKQADILVYHLVR